MVASVNERGYAGTRVSDLIELSGITRRSFYRLYADKEACLVATVQAMIEIGVAAAAAATPTSKRERATWEDQVAGVIQGFAEMVIAQPAAARLLLVETNAAGSAARGLLDGAFGAFEALGMQRISEHPDLEGLPAEMMTMYTATVQEVAARRLREGREDELPGLVGELAQLLAAYRPPPQPIRTATKPPAFPPETIDAHDRSERALRAFTAVVAERGYANASVSQAVKRASMSPTTFYASFRDKEDVMMTAIDSAGAQIVAAITPYLHRHTDWSLSVRAALGTFFNFLASRPSLARLLMVETYAAGPAALARRDAALAPLTELFDGWQRRAPQAPAIALEAIGAGIFGLIFKAIKDGGPESLPNLAAVSTYFALAPFIGADAACGVANSDGLPRPLRERHEADATVLRPLETRVLTFLAEREGTLREIADEIEVPYDEVAAAVDELDKGGLIGVAGEAPGADGDVEAIYRSPRMRIFDTEEWEALSRPEHERISAEIGALIAGDVDIALKAKTFDSRTDRQLVRMPLMLDDQGFRELARIHTAVLTDMVEIQAKTQARLKESGDAPLLARSIIALFEMPGEGEADV